jgi:hypothetical protein
MERAQESVRRSSFLAACRMNVLILAMSVTKREPDLCTLAEEVGIQQ